MTVLPIASRTPHLPGLTGLRLYAALLVFTTHFFLFKYFYGLESGPIYLFLEGLGKLGVSLFFTLSGFILYINYLARFGKKTTWIQFWTARFARVYPVFLVCLVLAAPIELLSQHEKSFLGVFLPNMFLIHCLTPYACGEVNPPGWSISVEAAFYLLFPFLGLLFHRRIGQNLILALGVFLLYIGLFTSQQTNGFYGLGCFPLNRLGEFTLGMATGYAFSHPKGLPKGLFWLKQVALSPWRNLVMLGLLGIMLIEPFVLGPHPIGQHLFYLYYALPGAAIILLIALADTHQSSLSLLTTQWAIIGGEISYSFYLVHQLVIRYLRHGLYYGLHLDLATLNPYILALLSLPLLAISLGCAYILYYTVEKPWRKKIVSFFSSQQPHPNTRTQPQVGYGIRA